MKMADNPLVSVIIPTRNRAEDLKLTLGILRRQTYSPLEVIVIDDASDVSLEGTVREAWPEAVFHRREVNVGQCQCRNDAFAMARGKYFLGLDDDACFTYEHDLARAVEVLESRPGVGTLTFFTFHGTNLPKDLEPQGMEHYVQTFLAGAGIIRKQVIEQTGGYQSFFGSEGEEEELSIRIQDAGYGILYFPGVLIHHRVSPRNRNATRTWERGLRNKLWLIFMHMPASRIPIEAGWKILGGFWEALRLLRLGRFFRALFGCASGLSQVLALRKPISPLTLRRYDAIRFRGIATPEEFADPPACGLSDLWIWFRNSWWNRPRVRSVWDRRPGDIGTSETSRFAHEWNRTKK